MYKIIKNSYNKTAGRYNESFRDIQYLKYNAIMAKKTLFIEPQSKILDLGCGTGLFGEFLKERLGYIPHLWGVDFSEKMLHMAGEAGYQIHLGDISELPYPDNMFDALVSFTVIRVTEDIDDRTVLEEIKRVVKTDGPVILTLLESLVDPGWEESLHDTFELLNTVECGQDIGYICKNSR